MDGSEDLMIRLQGVGKTYPGGTVAVQELDLDVPRGQLVTLVGPSGCGKSTTLKMINRLIEPSTGRIELDGEDVTRADAVQLRRKIGYVIQQIGLFPHQTIRANVATLPKLLGWDKRRTNERVDELLTTMGLEPSEYADRYPHQLSGGQRQRVGVARALAADPDVLLMDEPFGAVDPVVRTRLQDQFLAIQETLAKTVVLVTHDIEEAVRLGDRVAVFEPRTSARADADMVRVAGFHGAAVGSPRSTPPRGCWARRLSTTSSPSSSAPTAVYAGSRLRRSSPSTSSNRPSYTSVTHWSGRARSCSRRTRAGPSYSTSTTTFGAGWGGTPPVRGTSPLMRCAWMLGCPLTPA